MRGSHISSIEYVLPERVLTNEEIAASSEHWTADAIWEKTGIRLRHIAAEDETAGDLACRAGQKLLQNHDLQKAPIDLLLFCTQTPDYALPATACVLQEKLGLSIDCAAIGFNQGCSGYVYGLSLAKAMLESGEASRALFLTGETYSKWIDENDYSVKTIFGDAGTATLVETQPSSAPCKIGPFVYGTDGRGKKQLVVYGSGARAPEKDPDIESLPENHPIGRLFMDGPEIFSFTIRAVPRAVKGLLAKADLSWDEIDWVVFHQANRFMLEHLRKKCRVPEEKFVVDMEDYGNTVSNTIPIVLSNMMRSGQLKSGQRIMLVGFGVGFSWSATMIKWP